MQDTQKPSLLRRIRNVVIGHARNPAEHSTYHKLSLVALLAWVGLGADGLSSSAYGPAEAYAALQGHPHLGLLVALATAVTIFIISTSYSQIIELFPAGGGGYVVASKLLSPKVGMVAGCALLVDYVLTITISIASGVDALFSFFPADWFGYRMAAATAIIAVLMLMNLRGVRESVAPLVPIFVIFVLTHAFVIGYTLVTRGSHLGLHMDRTVEDIHAFTRSGGAGVWGMLFLVMHAYSMGAGTYTGIEAVSNGLPLLREPRVQTGKRVMTYMWVSLAVTVVGLMLGYLLFRVKPEDGKTMNAVLLETMFSSWGSGGQTFLIVTLVSEAALLFVAAQTGFLGGPRVLSYMATDRWFPSRLSMLSDRLVTQNGVLLMTVAALVTLWLTHGEVRYLVVLYSINVFITFLLSQAGMVRHWWSQRGQAGAWRKKLFINGLGAGLTLLILVWVTISKFAEGGWVTLLVTTSLVGIVVLIKRHYNSVGPMLQRLDALTAMAAEAGRKFELAGGDARAPAFNPNAKTAVLMVNGFNGFGMHTLLNILRFFGDTFKNFIFVQVGVVDAGNFKGLAETEHLRRHIEEQTRQYINFVRQQGFYGESVCQIGTDVVDEMSEIAPRIIEKHPDAVFFSGQLVFPKDNRLTRLLHNNITFAVQRRLYRMGVPFVILPIRV